jgi:hypothetical protein
MKKHTPGHDLHEQALAACDTLRAYIETQRDAYTELAAVVTRLVGRETRRGHGPAAMHTLAREANVFNGPVARVQTETHTTDDTTLVKTRDYVRAALHALGEASALEITVWALAHGWTTKSKKPAINMGAMLNPMRKRGLLRKVPGTAGHKTRYALSSKEGRAKVAAAHALVNGPTQEKTS